jgi:hypothetical protein
MKGWSSLSGSVGRGANRRSRSFFFLRPEWGEPSAVALMPEPGLEVRRPAISGPPDKLVVTVTSARRRSILIAIELEVQPCRDGLDL